MKSENLTKGLFEVYRTLERHFGRQGWWPLTTMAKKPGFDERGYHKGDYSFPKNGQQSFEISVGAILTQNTSWKNVEKAIISLKKENALNREAILMLPPKKLALLIKSSGYHNQKAKKLKAFAEFHGEITRERLLDIWGIGPETADSILLYAYGKPYFVIDAYTRRIMKRVGFIEESYDELQKLFMKNLPRDANLFNEFHALLVEHAKVFCQKKPLCEKCPLLEICEYGNKNS